MDWPDELVIQLARDRGTGRKVTFLWIGEDIIFDMWVIPSEQRSTISEAAVRDLFARGYVPPSPTPEHWVLSSLRLETQPIPDLDVRVDQTLTGVDGILGADVFGNYSDVRFDAASDRFLLTR